MRSFSIFVVAVLVLNIHAIEPGEMAPEISARDWHNSQNVSLAALRDKTVVLEFWATWCPHCVRSFPHLNELHDKYKDQGVVIIALSDESDHKVDRFLKQNPARFIVGASSRSVADYDADAIPHAVVIAPGGRIAWDGHPNDLDEVIEAVLEANSPEAKERLKQRGMLADAFTEIDAHAYSTALPKLKALAAIPEESQTKTAARQKLQELEALAAEHMKEADGKKPVEACMIYLEVSLTFAGCENADKAQKAAAKLMSDPEVAACFHPSMKK